MTLDFKSNVWGLGFRGFRSEGSGEAEHEGHAVQVAESDQDGPSIELPPGA